MDSFLIKLRHAVDVNQLPQCFTMNDVKKWVDSNNITNDYNNNQPYKESSIESALSSSVINGTSTKTDKGLYKWDNPRKYSFSPNGC